jgi:hypothetical protein
MAIRPPFFRPPTDKPKWPNSARASHSLRPCCRVARFVLKSRMRGRGGLQRLRSSRASQDAKTVPDIVSLRRLQTRLPCIVTKPPVDGPRTMLSNGTRIVKVKMLSRRSMQIPFPSLGLPFHSILHPLFLSSLTIHWAFLSLQRHSFFLCSYHTSFHFIHPSQILFTSEAFLKYPHTYPWNSFVIVSI